MWNMTFLDSKIQRIAEAIVETPCFFSLIYFCVIVTNFILQGPLNTWNLWETYFVIRSLFLHFPFLPNTNTSYFVFNSCTILVKIQFYLGSRKAHTVVSNVILFILRIKIKISYFCIVCYRKSNVSIY